MRSALIPVLLLQLNPPSPAPPELIDRLVANAQLYAQTLPSITASEAIVSEGSYMTIFRRTVHATGVFRVVRTAPGAPLDESRQITEVDGKPVASNSHPVLPWTLFGGFGRFQDLFFTPAHRPCYTFALLPRQGPANTLQIAIEQPPNVADIPGCKSVPLGTTGLARVDPVARQLVYLERTVPLEVAVAARLAPFASVELAPAKIGDDIFWLPTQVIGTFAQDKMKGKFTARYSNYHRYAGTVTILPGVTEVPPSGAPVPPQRQ